MAELAPLSQSALKLLATLRTNWSPPSKGLKAEISELTKRSLARRVSRAKVEILPAGAFVLDGREHNDMPGVMG